MKRRNFLAGMVAAAAVAGCTCNPIAKNEATAVSPDGHNEIRFQLKPFAYEVLRDGQTLVAKTAVGMKIDGACLCQNAMVKDVTTKALSGCVKTDVIRRASPASRAGPSSTSVNFGVRLVARKTRRRLTASRRRRSARSRQLRKGAGDDSGWRCDLLGQQTRSFGCEETSIANVRPKDGDNRKRRWSICRCLHGAEDVAVTETTSTTIQSGI